MHNCPPSRELNAVLAHADYVVAGWLNKTLTVSPYSLTTANAGDDEARAAMIKFTGTGSFTVIVPSVSKSYEIWNACTGVVTISTGTGASVALVSGEFATVACNATAVYRVVSQSMGGSRLQDLATPSAATDAATRQYVDEQAFAALVGDLPAQSGNGGKYLGTNGAGVSWEEVSDVDITLRRLRLLNKEML